MFFVFFIFDMLIYGNIFYYNFFKCNMGSIESIEYLSQRDCKLALLIKKVGKYVVEREDGDPFESLLRSIISQQLSGNVASSISVRFKNYYGDEN